MERIARLETLARAGYAARGLVYLLLGYYALSTGGGEATTTVLERLQEVPGGTIVLLVVAAGLVAYGLFRGIDAWLDLDGEDGDAKGKFKRIGMGLSAIAHLMLALAAVEFAFDLAEAGSGQMEREAAEEAMELPGGAVLVIAAGALVVVAGLGNLLEAWACSFRRALGSDAPGWTCTAGRIGYAARGAVFVLIGWQVISLATGLDDGRIGMESALADLRQNEWLFTAVAAGLVAFGAFSLLMGLYARVRNENVVARLKAGLRPR